MNFLSTAAGDARGKPIFQPRTGFSAHNADQEKSVLAEPRETIGSAARGRGLPLAKSPPENRCPGDGAAVARIRSYWIARVASQCSFVPSGRMQRRGGLQLLPMPHSEWMWLVVLVASRPGVYRGAFQPRGRSHAAV